MLHAIPPTVPALIAPATASDRDQFPACRNWRAGQPKPPGCRRQTKTYALLLTRPTVDPEHGEMVEEFTTEVTIEAGYIPDQGGGEITRMTAMVAPDGWKIAALFDMAEPATEF